MLTLILSVLGALGGALLLGTATFRGWRWIRRRWHNRVAAKRDYYFKVVDSACQIVLPDREVRFVRQVTIVSLTDGLACVRIGHATNVETQRTASVQPLQYTLAPAPPMLPDANWWEQDVCFDTPLGVGQRASFVLTVHSTYPMDPPDHHFSWMCERRVDDLVLRVIFCSPHPSVVHGQELGVDGSVLLKEPLGIDVASGESRWHIRWPRPGRRYAIVWP